MPHTRGITRKGPRLAREFLAAVSTAIASIRRHPEAYQLVDSAARRAWLRRFPYGIFFEALAPEPSTPRALTRSRRPA